MNNVTYGCIVVTHGASEQGREGRTIESCARFAAAIRFFAGRSGQYGSRLLSFHTASLSIPSTSRTPAKGRSCRRLQDCFYRQTIHRFGPALEVLRQRKRSIAGRHCGPRSGGFPSAKGKAWVIDHEVGIPRFSWNIDLIVCYRKNWNRFTRCCYRIGDGSLEARNHRRNRRTH